MSDTRLPTEPELLAGLNDGQSEATRHLDGPVLVVAGAGTGKTRVLTRRIALHVVRGVDPSRILAITFTTKAAGEMRERVAELIGPARASQMMIATFHSACLRLLREWGVPFDVVDERTAWRHMAAACAGTGIRPGEAAARIGYEKAYGRTAEDIRSEDEELAGIWERYEKMLRGGERLGLDFDDLLNYTIELARQDPRFLQWLQTRYDYVLVDEFQDTNRVQATLTSIFAGRTRNICAIGDGDQAIYMFRGATRENILDFERDWPGTKVCILDQNYRCSGNIIAAARAVIEQSPAKWRASLWTESPDGPEVEIRSCGDAGKEVAAVLTRIRSVDGGRGHAVLYRAAFQTAPLEAALLKAQIPYVISGSSSYFDRAEIESTLGYLRLVFDKTDLAAMAAALRLPARGVGGRVTQRLLSEAEPGEPFDELIHRCVKRRLITGGNATKVVDLVDWIGEIGELGDKHGPAAAVAAVLCGRDGDWKRAVEDRVHVSVVGKGGVANGLLSGGEEGQRLAGLQTLLDTAKGFEGCFAEFVERFGHGRRDDTDKEELDPQVVQLMTIHASKGLEFPHVTIIGCEEGTLPMLREGTDVEEERRLMYVAITRAQKSLMLTWARQRERFGEAVTTRPSRFVQDIKAARSGVKRRQPQIRPGEGVDHPKWGHGVVLELSGQGNDAVATVRFGDGDRRIPLRML